MGRRKEKVVLLATSRAKDCLGSGVPTSSCGRHWKQSPDPFCSTLVELLLLHPARDF